MQYLGFIVALPIIYLGYKFIRSASPKGFARELAKAQLKSYKVLRSKYPELKPEELYLSAIKLRPGYTEEEVANIIKKTKTAHKQNGTPFNFQEVVLWLVIYEYQNRTNESFNRVYPKLREGVTKVIPSNI